MSDRNIPPINIYGLKSVAGAPYTEILIGGFINDRHINLIELARTQWFKWKGLGKTYEAIILVLGDTETYAYRKMD